MPSKFPIAVSNLTEVYSRYLSDIYIENTHQLQGPTHDVWTNISNELDKKISAKYAYTIALQNRYSVLGEPKKKSSVHESSSSSEKEESEKTEKSELQFEICMPKVTWDELYTTAEYNREERSSTRVYHTLKPNEWTHFMQSSFFASTRLPCAIQFKRCCITETGNIFLKISGKCNQCESVFEGFVKNQPDFDRQTEVIFSCTYKGNFKGAKCCRKKHLRCSKLQSEYCKQLTEQNKSASFIRRAEASVAMDYGDNEPGHLLTNNALRILKHKTLKKNQLDNNPILAVDMLKGFAPYCDVIRDIGYDRFFVHYWSATELNSYRLYARRNPITKISIDASGHVVKKITLESGSVTPALFLYEIVVNDETVQFSVGHMLSSRHNNNAIAYWLSEWFNNDIPLPKVIITDMSLALMMAVVKTFTQYATLKKYLQVCSSLLLKVPNVEVPTSMLRCDFAHVMHLISAWPELNSASCTRRTKLFYMHAIALVVGCNDYQQLKELLRHIFIIALHTGGGFNEFGEETASRVSKLYLSTIIANHGIEKKCKDFESLKHDGNNDDKNDERNTVEPESDETTCQSDIFIEIQNIYDACEEESRLDDNKGDEDNAQFSPGIAKKLLKLCSTLPLWSGVMIEIFGYGEITESSAGVEASFNDVKHRIFHHKTLPLRVDEFLETHILAILGNMKLVAARYKTDKDSDETIFEFEQSKIDQHAKSTEKATANDQEKDADFQETTPGDNHDAEMNRNQSTENWKGEGVPLKKRKIRINYLQPNSSVLPMNKQSATVSKVVGVLRNGAQLDLKSVKIDKKYYNLRNTCPFDSIIQVMMTAYCDNTDYQSFVDNNADKYLLFELVANTVRDGVNTQTYRKQASLLQPIFGGEEAVSGLDYHITVDCASTAKHTISQLFLDFPSLIESFECTV